MFLWVGPLVALLVGVLAAPLGWAQAVTLAVTAWTAIWWLTEPVEVPFASLLPIILLPAAGVLNMKQIAEAAGNELLLLLGGGFMLSTALEASGAHKRLALLLLTLVGGDTARRVLFGFIAATTLLSMWVSNTGATLMMLPIARAALDGGDKRLAPPLVLGIAYAASIGGLGTPIGSPPNVVFLAEYEKAAGHPFGFFNWMKLGVPVAITFSFATWLWLGRGLHGAPGTPLPKVGGWTPAQRRVLAIFAVTALAWATRTDPFGGWTAAVGVPATDGVVALAGVLAMAVTSDGVGGRLLQWEQAREIPWGTLMLFGGGIAIANAFEVSKLSQTVAGGLGGLADLPAPLLMLALCAGVTALSEIASNTAAAILLMPVLASVGLASGADPALYMLPGVLAASCGFALPVATGPNAIAHGSGLVPTAQMMREGLVVDLIGTAVLSVGCWLYLA